MLKLRAGRLGMRNGAKIKVWRRCLDISLSAHIVTMIDGKGRRNLTNILGGLRIDIPRWRAEIVEKVERKLPPIRFRITLVKLNLKYV